ncbi:MAG: IS3 family transposase [Planctomycetes bacterium]|nr:IS3 family transposase [Planctomycetota bacterium]
MKMVEDLAGTVGTRAACAALKVPRATIYRHRRKGGASAVATPRRGGARALSQAERQAVLDELLLPEHADLAVPQVYARLLDDKRYLCSIRTMYRILHANRCVRERRDQLRHPSYSKPELLATAPNQVWSWDITKLPGPRKGSHFHLYVVIDIYSRFVVGWLVASREFAELAQRTIRDACARNGVAPGQLTIHSDRGAAMTSKPLAQLYADLGIVRSLSRPHTSNDNPFSEAQFKTLKYRPSFPERMGSPEDARHHAGATIRWYNNDHRHSGLALLTPADVHFQRTASRLEVRDAALDAAFAAHPERFVRGAPRAQRPPAAAWINPPAPGTTTPLPQAAEVVAH